MPYWDHKKAIGSAGGFFAIPIYPPAPPPYGGLRGVPLRLPELASLGSTRNNMDWPISAAR